MKFAGTRVYIRDFYPSIGQCLLDMVEDKAEDNRVLMPGGLTRGEFEGLREDIQEIISEHPRAKFTFVFIDDEGKVTEDPDQAKRYGLTVHEDDALIHEEFGEADWVERDVP